MAVDRRALQAISERIIRKSAERDPGADGRARIIGAYELPREVNAPSTGNIFPKWCYDADTVCRRCGLHFVHGVSVARAAVNTNFGMIVPLGSPPRDLCESCQAFRLMEKM